MGWNVSVYRQSADRSVPARADAEVATRIAVWQTGLVGLEWIVELVRAGRAHPLGGDGYPCRYTALATDLIPMIISGPPEARDPWVYDPGDVLSLQWVGHTLVDRKAAECCLPDEWLVIETWDES